MKSSILGNGCLSHRYLASLLIIPIEFCLVASLIALHWEFLYSIAFNIFNLFVQMLNMLFSNVLRIPLSAKWRANGRSN